MDQALPEGLSYKGKGAEVKASQESVNKLVGAFNRLLEHPIICGCILLLIGFMWWDWNRSRVKVVELKEAYGTRRFTAQQQYSLPLILEEPKKTALPSQERKDV